MVVFSHRNAEELFQSSSAPTVDLNFNKKGKLALSSDFPASSVKSS